MKKKKKGYSENDLLHKIRLGAIRKEQVAQGVFDGRYRTRTISDSKVYKRCRIKLENILKDA
jgi:hypothetical protein